MTDLPDSDDMAVDPDDVEIHREAYHDAAESLVSAFEKRRAKEALGAWRAGFRYLLTVKPHDPGPLHAGLEGYSMEFQIAFVPKHARPKPEWHPDGYRYEVIDLTVLDNDRKRQRIRNQLWGDEQ